MISFKSCLRIIGILAMPLVLFSCGPSKKMKAATEQINTLQANVTDLTGKLSASEAKAAQLGKENEAYAKEMQDCREMADAIEKNLKSLNKALAAEGTDLRKIQQKAETALMEFDQAGAEVTYKNGFVFISFNDKLLFKSGSAVLSEQGHDAIAVIAQVLSENPNVKAYVVGNTDDQKVRSGFKDNWSLSTERANSIVRSLIESYKTDPTQLTAAGKGKYNPVADNTTPEGKAKNRRTDIIINPNLSRLWEATGASSK